MATRSQQRAILLASIVVTVVSLSVIGYRLLPALLGNSDSNIAQITNLPPVSNKKAKAEIEPAAPLNKKIEKIKKTPPVKETSAPSVIKSAEAAVQNDVKPSKPKQDTAPVKPAPKAPPIVSPIVSPIASLQKSKMQTGDEKETEPKRPYEESLPGDIYEPPDIKIPTRKSKVPKARRIKKSPKNKRVRTSRLPAIKRSQLPPWRRYAVHVPYIKEDKGKPKIVMVIDDMGVDLKRSKRIVALPGPLTLSYLTYAKKLYKQTRAARKAGHEIMLHVAMEPANMQNDPGPRVLLRDLEPDEIQKRLVWGLSRLHRYVGINNHMGSKFTSDRYGMTIVMKELRRRGLLFLDSRTINKSVGAVIAHAIGVPYAERNIFIDNVNKLSAVQNRLAELEGLARRRGKAIAIGHPRDATIKALSTWLTDVKSRGFIIVPISKNVLVPKIAG